MKMQDFQCPSCGLEVEGLTRPGEEHRVCSTCGLFMTPIKKAVAHVIPDDVPGGFTIENMGPQPEHFRSKSEWKRRMKELGLVNMVRHKGVGGSDKSKETSRWI